MRSILVDIDHTISAAWDRDPMIGVESWDEYHNASKSDQPIQHMANLVNDLAWAGYNIIGMTARPEKWRQLTLDWLIKHGIVMHELLMRPDDAFHPAPEIKVNLAKQRFGDDLPIMVAFIMDDREDVILAFQELGVPGMIVHGRRMVV